MSRVKKVIIAMAGMGTRFLPLSKILPKQNLPLLGKPLFSYLVEEAKLANFDEIIFVLSSKKDNVLDYFRSNKKLIKFLKERRKKEILKKLLSFEKKFENLSFKFAFQKKPQGDAHALFCAKNFLKKEAVAAMWVDDIIISKTPAISQLLKIYQTSGLPVIGLFPLEKEKLSSYGVVSGQKIKNRLYRIEKIVEKPDPQSAPSNLAIVGRFILTEEVFSYIKKEIPPQDELILTNVFEKMIDDGKIIYGYEIEGNWLECGDEERWIKSFLYLALLKKEFKDWLKKFL